MAVLENIKVPPLYAPFLFDDIIADKPHIILSCDVLAQCVISPDISTLTITDGLVRDVEFHCQCMDDNGMMITGTRWLLPNGNAAPTQNVNILPAVLYIAMPFNNIPDAGTYICSPNNMANDLSRDTINLVTGSEYVQQ